MFSFEINATTLLDNGTVAGELAEGAVQIGIWSLVLGVVQRLIEKNCVNKPWFKNLDNIQPQGCAEWVMVARALPNHVCLMWYWVDYIDTCLLVVN